MRAITLFFMCLNKHKKKWIKSPFIIHGLLNDDLYIATDSVSSWPIELHTM
jgi:hypothetical protein